MSKRAMSLDTWVASLKFLAEIGALLAAIISWVNHNHIKQVKYIVNSHRTQLLDEIVALKAEVKRLGSKDQMPGNEGAG